MPRSIVRVAASLALACAVAGGCTDDQDPGLDPGGVRPAPTSDTLGRCPAGGPDATTPAAGCLDGEGRVQRP